MQLRIFNAIARALYAIGRKTRMSYEEINILVYFFLIPFSWLWLLDSLIGFHYLKLASILSCLGFSAGCRDFKSYSNWLFGKSVMFLNYFNRFGSNYVVSSVWICVSIPLIIYLVLFFMLYSR